MNIKKQITLLLILWVANGAIGQNQYSYDQNGNLISNNNKEIVAIIYNVLNLPEEILFSDGRKIINTYTADGKKLGQETLLEDTTVNSRKDYLDNIVYNSGQLEYINIAEGYIEPARNHGFTYSYQHKDQGDNIRGSFADVDGNGIPAPVKEEKNYYPFGLQWQQPDAVVRGRQHNYGYGGKEEIKAFGLDWNDHGARMYDPAIARWNGIDELAEKYVALSPYHYVMNNPIIFNDPDGKDAEFTISDKRIIIKSKFSIEADFARLEKKYGLTRKRIETTIINNIAQEWGPAFTGSNKTYLPSFYKDPGTGKKYEVWFEKPEIDPSSSNTITITDNLERMESSPNGYTRDKKDIVMFYDQLGLSAHEYGHTLGLQNDIYTEDSEIMTIDDQGNYELKNIVGTGEGIMANKKGYVQKRHIDQIVSPIVKSWNQLKTKTGQNNPVQEATGNLKGNNQKATIKKVKPTKNLLEY